MTEPHISSEELEKKWAEEMKKNFMEPVIIMDFPICVCKHCGGCVYLPLSMQHLKLMHPEPYGDVMRKWDELQMVKNNANG